MENMEEKEGIAFWSKSEGGFTGVTDKTVFYMNEKENPVIVFDKYEIAPGAYGKLEFEIDKTGTWQKEPAIRIISWCRKKR